MRVMTVNTTAALAVAACLAWPTSASAVPDLVVNVDCTRGAGINRALDRPAPVDRRLVVIVSGTCTENVTIERDDVVLRAHASGGGVNAADSAKSAIDINSAKRVALEGLTVVGGRLGVNATGGASVAIRGGAVRDAVWSGIYVGGGASASVDGSAVENHGGPGVLVEGASLALTNSTVRANQYSGVSVTRGAHARLGATDDAGVVCCGNTIQDNRIDGVTLADSASALLYGNIIQGNGKPTNRFGVLAVNESVANMRGGNVISNNGSATGGGGVFARASTIRTGAGDAPLSPTTNEISGNGSGVLGSSNSLLDLRGGLSITGNNFSGVVVDQGSRLRMQNGTISGNGAQGVFVVSGSSANFLGGSNVVVANGAFGLNCADGESHYSGYVGGISGNTAGDVSCTFYPPPPPPPGPPPTPLP
jgi:Right handed beta helix region